MNVEYRFVDYGTVLAPEPATLVLDVGMATAPGVIDHHHPDAEPECTASLVAKHPRLVLDHLPEPGIPELLIVTHRLPDFDAVAAIFLALRLLETRAVDEAMRALASYARLADSASLPKTVELAETPYAVLRALFAGTPGTLEEISLARIREGLKFMGHLAGRAAAGVSLIQGRGLFKGIDRYERAVRRCREDHLSYLDDVDRARKERLRLPAAAGAGRREVDALFVRGPTSFLLKEWARRDREHASLGRGFSFLMTGFGHRRIILGVDPESGVHLRGLGDRLDAREAERRAAEGRPMVAWYPGDAPLFGGRIIDSPRDGTSLSFDEVLAEVLAFGA